MVTRKTKGAIAIPAALVGFSAGSMYGATYQEVCSKQWKNQAERNCCGTLWFKGASAVSALNSCKSSYNSGKSTCDVVQSSGLTLCDAIKTDVEAAEAYNKSVNDQYAKDLAACAAETPSRDQAACFYPPTGSCKDTENGPKCYLKPEPLPTDALWGGINYSNYSSCVTYYNNDHTSCINLLGNCSAQEAALAAVDSALTSCLSSSGG
jgi:hypothetical protein